MMIAYTASKKPKTSGVRFRIREVNSDSDSVI